MTIESELDGEPIISGIILEAVYHTSAYKKCEYLNKFLIETVVQINTKFIESIVVENSIMVIRDKFGSIWNIYISTESIELLYTYMVDKRYDLNFELTKSDENFCVFFEN